MSQRRGRHDGTMAASVALAQDVDAGTVQIAQGNGNPGALLLIRQPALHARHGATPTKPEKGTYCKRTPNICDREPDWRIVAPVRTGGAAQVE